MPLCRSADRSGVATRKSPLRPPAASVAGVRGVIAEIEIRQPTPKATSDTAVTIRVSRALEQHPFVPRGSITVTVDHGDVTLRGVVAFEHQRRAAEHALLDLAGVRKIINHILVESEHATGAAIASAIAETLAVSDERGERSIDITFDRGTVMLRGTVPNWAASRHAEAAARTVSGVRRVINLLIIRD